MFRGGALALATVLPALVAAQSAPGPVLTVPGLGKLQGAPDTYGMSSFFAIPYAEPPVEALRWQPPKELTSWGADTLNATAFGKQCMQGASFGAPPPMDEDCLFLNVATPTAALSGGKKLPVMLWIHGGAYQTGASNDYCGPCLVASSKNSVVVVTINYRLNVFGFLGGSEVKDSTRGHGAGNFGIQDQRMAIAWTKAHIAAFGGDGEDITIFGESAGGNSVINHLAQPASFGLYTKAIVESGAYNLGAGTMEEAETNYKKLLASSSCSSLSCLKALKQKDLLAANKNCGPGPVVDGVSLTDTPAALFAAKNYNNKVPVIIGSNRDEEAFFTLLEKVPNQINLPGLEAYYATYDGMKPEKIAELLKVYDKEVYPYPEKLGNFSQSYWTLVRSGTDSIPGLGPCAVRWIDRMLLEGGTPALYTYLYAHPSKGGLTADGTFASHASEISFVFGGYPGMEEAEEALALKVSAYWYSFAISPTGDPNPGGSATQWPKYTAEGDHILRLQEESEGGIIVETGLRKAACDWQQKQNPDIPGGGGGPDL